MRSDAMSVSVCLSTAGAPTGFFPGRAIGGGRGQCLGGTRASAEQEHITGVWCRVPSGVQGLSYGQGIRGQSPPEAESILVIGWPTEPALIN